MNAIARSVRETLECTRPPTVTVTTRAPFRAPHPEAYAAGMHGRWLEYEGRFEEARAAYYRALEIDPQFDGVRMHLGCLYLAEGDHARAWPLLEHREKPLHKGPGPARWRGQRLRGKTLAVVMEAGFGDQIQFARFVPLLRSRGGRVVLMCPAELARLYRSLVGVDQIYPVGSIPAVASVNIDIPLRPDYYIELCSIPHIFNVRSIPQQPYLRADPADIERWRSRLPESRLCVGLVWKGSVTNMYDPWRSLPSLATLAPLWQVPGVSFVSLQKGQGEDEARACPLPLVHLGSEVKDFADTAAILAQLDLLVSVDTSTAHLGHALGRPVWLLLKRVPDWRNLPESVRRWFPQARGFYQHQSGEWSGAVDDVAAALTEESQKRLIV